jgi:hypothetical protein
VWGKKKPALRTGKVTLTPGPAGATVGGGGKWMDARQMPALDNPIPAQEQLNRLIDKDLDLQGAITTRLQRWAGEAPAGRSNPLLDGAIAIMLHIASRIAIERDRTDAIGVLQSALDFLERPRA